MKEFIELIRATLAMLGYLLGMLIWLIAIAVCVGLVISLPIFAVAGVYKVICLICHMPFCWEIPVIIGIAFVALFGLTGLDQIFD